MKTFIAVDLGGTNIRAALVSEDGQILDVKKDKTEALDSDIIAVNEKETLGAKVKRYNTGDKADNSAG